MNLQDLRALNNAVELDTVRRITDRKNIDPQKRFTGPESEWLKKNGHKYTAQQVGARLGFSPNTVRHRATALGVQLKYERNHKSE
jgi:hypothetical protein